MTIQKTNNSGASQSLWMEVPLRSFDPLQTDIKTDVCIVGAGITGLTCAYTLAKEGKSVVILDQGFIGGGQTARTTAHLSWVLDDRYFNLENYFGISGAKLAAESHAAAIDYIEKIIRDEGIECDFERVNGYLFASTHKERDTIEKELIAIRKIGHHLEKVARAPFTTFDTGPCLQFPKQAQFHILKYIEGLINAILKYDVKIFSQTHVSMIKENPSCIVETEFGFKVFSDSIVMATCTPINNRFFIHTKQSSYQTYVIAASLPKGTVEKALYWDTADPYHYIRIHPHATNQNLEWLIIGGEDHKTGQEKKPKGKFDKLEKWARNHFSFIDEFEYHWSGQVFEPIDSLGFIGKNPGDRNTYIATGDSGNGVTHGTIAGILIPDLILDKKNSWEKLYDPSRKTFSAISKFIKENSNVAVQYADWLTPGNIKEIENLAMGEGTILRKGLKKLAIYKDEENKIHVNSAFCPHLGGCVHWNSCEKSWDCPCHGSRFDGCGKVINGPAIDDLTKVANWKDPHYS